MSVASAIPGTVFRFGVFEADVSAGELRRNGHKLRLSEQPLQILLMLLERPGEIISREELRGRLWHDQSFGDFDHGLNNAVLRLREALGDSSDNPRFIATVHRRGYRIIAPVQLVLPAQKPGEETTGEVETPAAISNQILVPVGPPGLTTSEGLAWPVRLAANLGLRRKLIAFALIALCAGVLLIVSLIAWSAHKAAGAPASLVVLPLENLSGDPNQDYFADGMTDDLIANLAKIRSLRVISRSTAMAYKGTRRPLSQIARELHVDAVVEGTVLRVGDRVRITAELVQVSSDHHLWADTYESQMGDVLALQNRVSSAIVNEIRINLTPGDRERLAGSPSVHPEAYENYLKGRYYWNKRTSQSLTRAIGYFGQAVQQDSRYALAYAGLADSYSILGATIFGSVSTVEAAGKAKDAAEKALALDPQMAEAQTSLATVKFNYDWDWSGAESDFRRAIQLDPNYATAYQRYSLYLMAMGRVQSSLEQIDRARQLDPLSISINFSDGWRLYLARQYANAAQQLRDTLEMDPSNGLVHLILGQTYEYMGNTEAALTEFREAARLSPGTPLMTAGLAAAYARSGNRPEALKLLASLSMQAQHEYVSPYYIAVVYAALGESNQALDWLDKAYADRSNGLVFLKMDPDLDPLRGNPRFKAIQKKLQFPES
jgi:TolB-like protein/DNA-binding winged helix-turn-helix (wHTH) protein/Tfp pilus assembly protein PilF